MVRAAPLTSPIQAPLTTRTRPVKVQMMMVSMKVPVMEMRPCSAGHFVLAAAATIGALPRPDSLEKTPRATPLRIATSTVAPRKPPAAAVGVKALTMICSTAAGIWSAKTTRKATVETT